MHTLLIVKKKYHVNHQIFISQYIIFKFKFVDSINDLYFLQLVS